MLSINCVVRDNFRIIFFSYFDLEAMSCKGGTLIVLFLNLCWKIYIVDSLMFKGWSWHPKLDGSTVVSSIGISYVNIVGIMILLPTFVSLIQKTPSTVLLNSAIIYFIVDLISMCFGVYMVHKDFRDEILGTENVLEHASKLSGFERIKTLQRNDLIKRLVGLVVIIIVLQLISIVVVCVYRVTVKRTPVQSKRQISQAPIPPVEQKVYYVPPPSNGFVSPPDYYHLYPSIPSYNDANSHVGFK